MKSDTQREENVLKLKMCFSDKEFVEQFMKENKDSVRK